MKSTAAIFLLSISMVLCFVGWKRDGNSSVNTNNDTIIVNLNEMKRIGSVDDRFQSYNVEMVEVVGGEFWRPYKSMDSLPSSKAASSYDVSQKNEQMYRKLPPINLADKRLLNLAKGLAPAYVRVSGTWANGIYFQDNDNPQMTKAPEGFVNILTRSEWKGVVDFLKATNGKLITSFAVSNGVRDANGIWTPIEAEKIAKYTKSLGGSIAGAELFNEPSIPNAGGAINKNYNAANFAKDIAVFRTWGKNEVPDMLLIGPGSVMEGVPGLSVSKIMKGFLPTDSLMMAEPQPQFDVFSYHYYGAVSRRMASAGPMSIKPENALNPEWLQRTESVADYYIGLRDKYLPNKPVWLTETAEAAAGGDPFAATWLDCFRYLYQLGSLAKKGVQVVMHNTLAASEYSLIDQDTHLPKPNYWAALLWARLMGTEVYEAGKGAPGVYLFAHSLKGNKNGKTLLVINTNKQLTTIHVPLDAEQYTLTSSELQGNTVLLNGQELKLNDNDMLPAIAGRKIKTGNVELPSTSITFFTFNDTGSKKSE
jgi:heparanase 1